MTVDMCEAYVLRQGAEGGKDTKFYVMVGELGPIGLKGGVFDAGKKTFDKGFAVGDPFDVERGGKRVVI